MARAETLEELARRIRSALDPIDQVRAAWLFGSQTTGAATARSDLDVAVVFPRHLADIERERVRRRIVAALTDALGALGERADVVDVDRALSAVAFRAAHDGVRVISRSESERVRAEVRIARRYDDDAPRRALYRAAACRHAGAGDGRS